jgi:Cu/Zn superoxide dismutase
MHIRFFAFLFAASLTSGAAALASDNSGGRVFDITAQNGSGEHGTVALKPRGDKTVVEVHIIGAPKTAQPAHIHLGTCDKLDPAPKYPLTPIVDGISETTVDASVATLTATAMAVNVHKSADDIKTYVACGNL